MDEQELDDEDNAFQEHLTIHKIYMLISSILTPEEMGYIMVEFKGKKVPGKVPSTKTLFQKALESNKISKQIKNEIIFQLDSIGKIK